MLKGNLLHPDILRALASAGHGSKVLIADSNYPFETHVGPHAEIVYLNLSPGTINVTQALDVVAKVVPIEAAEVMMPSSGIEPLIFGELRHHLRRLRSRQHPFVDLIPLRHKAVHGRHNQRSP